MNIRDFCPVKTLNIEAALADAPYGTGTFKNILDKVYDGTISLLVNNNGDVIGGNYNSGKTGAEDSIEQKKFERAYCGKPIMTYLEAAVKLYANGEKIIEVNEEDPNNIYVINSYGERTNITEHADRYDPDDEYEDEEDEDELPDEISLEDLDLDLEDSYTERDLRRAIRNYTGYFVARDAELDIVDDYVVGIKYGRKASDAELD